MTNRYSTTTFDNLVELARSIRPDWQTPGIRDAVRKRLAEPDAVHLADLTYELVRIASDPTIKTPAVLTQTGPHRRKTLTAADTIRPLPRCDTCHTIHAEGTPCGDPHRPDDPVAKLADARRELESARADLCKHGVPRTNCLICDSSTNKEDSNAHVQ